jgi:hypothetical protein
MRSCRELSRGFLEKNMTAEQLRRNKGSLGKNMKNCNSN